MPDIRPFPGIFYNTQKVKLEDVVAPPYDVILPQQQSYLYERNQYNVVRLILGREKDRYTSAAHFFEEWQRKKMLLRDNQTCVYLLTQAFDVNGKQCERRGFIVACRLEDFGKGSIFPHERTHSKPKADRFRLVQATHAMFSQIFGLYSDPKHHLAKYLNVECSPDYEVEFENIINRLWRITDNLVVSALSDFFKNQKIVVADGHHRYETAILYRDLLRLKNPSHNGREPYNFVPMFLTNMHDPGLQILPTHRIVFGLAEFKPETFLEDLMPFFQLSVEASEEKLLAHLREKKNRAFGLVLPKSPKFILCSLKDMSLPFGRRNYRSNFDLDVELLHSLVFKDILHISDESQENKLNIDYEKDADKAIQAVKDKTAQAAFLMNPTSIEQVRAVAETGATMPQKSTFFYPKLLSGMVMYSFQE